jgi:hypothetical protein
MLGLRIAVFAAAVTALAVTLPTAFTSEAAVRPPTVRVIGVMNSGAKVEETSYSLRRLRDLRITAYWNVPGTHVQRLEIRAPDGSLYQRLTKTFTKTSPNTPVLTVLPVGGTWITEYSLVGDWRIDVYLDAGRTPLTSYTLTLTR